jgi:hypothetical protein
MVGSATHRCAAFSVCWSLVVLFRECFVTARTNSILPLGPQVHGLRQEMRFSFYAEDLATGVRSVLHVYRTPLSPFSDFSAAAPNDSLELEVEVMTYEQYIKLLEWRFKAAAEVAPHVFYGRDNASPPSPLVFPILADLVNTLGLHFGQRCVHGLLCMSSCTLHVVCFYSW